MPTWSPYQQQLEILTGSVFDFSALADAPAGKHGPLTVTADGHFEFARRPGVRARFWGVNLCFDANYPGRATAEQLAATLQRSGYNAVRFHHYDLPLMRPAADGHEIDPQRLDQLDFLFHALKQRGLYINIDLYTIRAFTPDEIPDFGRKIYCEIKPLIHFSDRAFDAWAKFAKDLLTHRNPHTGLRWGEDPALIGICPVNEDTIFDTAREPELQPLFREQFARWLREHPAAGDDARAYHQFLLETQTRTDRRMFEFIRSLNVSVPLTGQNYRDAQCLTLSRRHYDYVDNHAYWDHPEFPRRAWQFPTQQHLASATAAAARVPREMFPTRLFGKPFTVTEFNYVWPNPHRAEGSLLMPAYAALQDWDAVFCFDYASVSEGLGTSVIPANGGKVFALTSDPVNLLGNRAAAWLFLSGGIRPASGARCHIVDADTALSGEKFHPAPFAENLSLLGLKIRVGSLPAGDPLAVNYNTDPPPPAPGPLHLSETGQLALDTARGTFTLASEFGEGFVLPAGVRLDGQRVSVSNSGDFCTVSVLAVDGLPLAESRRVLILHLSNSVNTGTVFNPADPRLCETPGRHPHLLQDAATGIIFRPADTDNWTCWVVDATGARLRRAALQVTDSGLLLNARILSGEGTAIAYELVAGV